MPHIAVVVSGLLGRMHSGFELISRLEGEGHRVTCLCQPYTTEIVAKQGFDYLEIPEINFKYADVAADFDADADNFDKTNAEADDDNGANVDVDADGDANMGTDTRASAVSTGGAGSVVSVNHSSWPEKFKAHLKNGKGRYERGKKQLKLDAYEKIWSELRPDHVLVDVELHDLIFTAYAAQIPITLFHTWFSDAPDLRLPPIRTAIIPGRGFEGSTMGITWARFIDWAKIQARLYINKLTFQDYRRATIKGYAQEIGFPMRDLKSSTLPPLYRFTKLPILLLAMRELDFPHKPDKNLTYAGPMVYENRHDLDAASADAKRLNTIYETKKTSGKKLIYCSVGSLAKGDVSFLKKVIEVVGKEKGWLLILSLGRNLSFDAFPDSPENVHLFLWVPQLKVLAHADCCINHAGINSINECLHYAVPMVIYSLKYTDENGNAARMAYHGLAVVGDKDQDGMPEIHKNIELVVTNTKYADKISEFNGLYKEYSQRKLSPLIFKG